MFSSSGDDDTGIGGFTPNETSHFPGVPGRMRGGGFRTPSPEQLREVYGRIQQQFQHSRPTPVPAQKEK